MRCAIKGSKFSSNSLLSWISRFPSMMFWFQLLTQKFLQVKIPHASETEDIKISSKPDWQDAIFKRPRFFVFLILIIPAFAIVTIVRQRQ